jgi:hypothetical protein
MTDVVTAEVTVEAPVAVEPLFTFKTIAAPFTAEGNDVKVGRKTLLRHIGGVTLLNSTVRASLTIEQTEIFDNMLMELMLSDRTINRVPSFDAFFDGEAQFAKILATSKEDNLQFAKNIGMTLNYVDIGILQAYGQIKQQVVDFFTALREAGKPDYAFAEGSEEQKLNFRTNGSRGRQVQTPGGYWIGETSARRLWDACFAFWSDPENTRTSVSGPSIRHSDYSRSSTIYRGTVNVGCQTMTRYQVEQAALKFGFI